MSPNGACSGCAHLRLRAFFAKVRIVAWEMPGAGRPQGALDSAQVALHGRHILLAKRPSGEAGFKGRDERLNCCQGSERLHAEHAQPLFVDSRQIHRS